MLGLFFIAVPFVLLGAFVLWLLTLQPEGPGLFQGEPVLTLDVEVDGDPCRASERAQGP